MIAELMAVGGVVTTASTVTLAIMAYRARGEALDARRQANDAAERARIAEAKADAAKARIDEAEARAAASRAEYKAADARCAALLSELDRERREKQEIYEQLASAGVPVGGVLVDAATDRLYADPHGHHRKAGIRADGGDDREGVPGDAAAPAEPTKPDH